MDRGTQKSHLSLESFTPLNILILYLLVGGAWILLSDFLLEFLVADVNMLARYQVVKDSISLLITTAVVYLLVRRKSIAVENSQKALQESEEKYRVLFESASEGIIIVNLEGVIELANTQAQQLFGYSRKELIGTGIEKLLPSGLRERHRAHRRNFAQDLRPRPMGKGRDLVALHKSGSEFPVEVSLSPVQTSSGTLIMAFVTDITERRKAENAVLAERDRAQKYLDIAGVIILVLNADGTVSLINKMGSRLLGHDVSDIVGKDWFTHFIPGEWRDEMRALFAQMIAGEVASPEYFENPIVTRSGQRRIIAWHNILLRDENGNVIGTLSSGEDITTRLEAEEQAKIQQQQLIQADKMATLGILVSGVAHEINNPNNFIMLNGKIISRVWNDAMPILDEFQQRNGEFTLAGMEYTRARQKIGQLIEGVPEGARRIQRIVESLKDFARQDKGDINQEVDINAVVESSIIIVNNLIKKSTHHFSVTYGQNLPRVRGNFQQLEQIVINLVTNACQALPEPSRALSVVTHFDRKNRKVQVKVSDQGTGIPQENFRRIFDPFFTTKRDSGGTGLGLSICYSIARSHGGQLSLESELDKGTTVTLILPALRS